MGLARGGVVVAAEVARRLGLPLDALAVRKVRHPFQPEYGIGPVTPGGGIFVRPDPRRDRCGRPVPRSPRRGRVPRRSSLDIDAACPRVALAGRICVLVDDGLATGATMVAAARWSLPTGASRVVIAGALLVPLRRSNSFAPRPIWSSAPTRRRPSFRSASGMGTSARFPTSPGCRAAGGIVAAGDSASCRRRRRRRSARGRPRASAGGGRDRPLRPRDRAAAGTARETSPSPTASTTPGSGRSSLTSSRPMRRSTASGCSTSPSSALVWVRPRAGPEARWTPAPLRLGYFGASTGAVGLTVGGRRQPVGAGDRLARGAP